MYLLWFTRANGINLCAGVEGTSNNFYNSTIKLCKRFCLYIFLYNLLHIYYAPLQSWRWGTPRSGPGEIWETWMLNFWCVPTRQQEDARQRLYLMQLTSNDYQCRARIYTQPIQWDDSSKRTYWYIYCCCVVSISLTLEVWHTTKMENNP